MTEKSTDRVRTRRAAQTFERAALVAELERIEKTFHGSGVHAVCHYLRGWVDDRTREDRENDRYNPEGAE